MPEAELEDLRRRLRATQWPSDSPAAAWEQGIPLGYLRELVGYWAEAYDWRKTEARPSRLRPLVGRLVADKCCSWTLVPFSTYQCPRIIRFEKEVL